MNNSLTVTLKTAQELKKWGFKQETEFYYIQMTKNGEWTLHHKDHGVVETHYPEFAIAASTAEEVLRELPHKIGKNEDYSPTLIVTSFDDDKESILRWKVAYVENEEEGSVIHVWENSLSDAAALMFIYLKKEGLI